MSDLVDEVTEAFRALFSEHLARQEDLSRSPALQAANEAFEARMWALAGELPEPERTAFTFALMRMPYFGILGSQIAQNEPSDFVREAAMIVREARMDRLSRELGAGETDFVWPPARDVDWDTIRVMVAHFMNERVADWPAIALVDGPGMGSIYSPYLSAVQSAQIFLQAWLQPNRDEFLAEMEIDADTIATWESYLELSR